MLLLLAAVLTLLILSAISSGSEVALFAVPYSQVLSAYESGRRGGRALKRVKENMARPIMVIVIWNNVANIVGSIAVGALATRHFGDAYLGAFSAALTLAVIIFAEIIPKTIGEKYALRLALAVAPPVLLLSRALLPLIVMIELLARPFLRSTPLTTSEEEIRALTRLGGQAGVIEQDEQELIHRVFQLNDVTAGAILTPLAMVDALPAEATVGEVREQVLNFNHTRLPIFEGGRIDRVTGIVNVRAVLRALAEDRGDLPVSDLAETVSFVVDAMPADDLLRHFQKRRHHLAVVVNGVSTVLGVVTLEDVLEELVGEIDDETDVESLRVQELRPGVVRAHALSDVREVNQALGTSLPEEGRVGEYIVEALGRLPRQGERFELGELSCLIEEATPRGIRSVQLTRRPPPPDES